MISALCWKELEVGSLRARSLPPNLRIRFTLGICQLIAARLLWKQTGFIVEEGMHFITKCQAGKSKYL